jgi:hypothetical protein
MNVETTEEFDDWLDALRDEVAKAKIASRIDRLANGNPGDVKPVGEGISEMRIHHALATESTTVKMEKRWSSSYVAATRIPKRVTSQERKNLRAICEVDCNDQDENKTIRRREITPKQRSTGSLSQRSY